MSTAISLAPELTAHGRRVVSFYERSLTGHRRLRLATPAALHLGFWDERTRNHAEALANMNRALAKRADLQPTGIDIFRFEDGKVVESWDSLDRLGMMRWLGVMPAPEGTVR